jgi:hypothetical protein
MAESSSTVSCAVACRSGEIVIFFRPGHFDGRIERNEREFDVDGKDTVVIPGPRKISMWENSSLG